MIFKDLVLIKIYYWWDDIHDKYYFIAKTKQLFKKECIYGQSCPGSKFKTVCNTLEELANGNINRAILMARYNEPGSIGTELTKRILVNKEKLKLIKFEINDKEVLKQLQLWDANV